LSRDKSPLSEEHKQKLKEGREKARQRKLELGIPLRKKKGEKKREFLVYNGNKVKLKLPKNPRDAFSYFQIIRETCRGLNDYTSAPKIIQEIIVPSIWKNIVAIETILQKYFILIS
jgi:hypothetical protein